MPVYLLQPQPHGIRRTVKQIPARPTVNVQQPILERALAEGGFYHQLRHNAVAYFDRGNDHLIVTFDDLTLAGKKRDVCWGEDFVRKHAFSHLGILAGRRDWYGAPDLETYLGVLRPLCESDVLWRFNGGICSACIFKARARINCRRILAANDIGHDHLTK